MIYIHLAPAIVIPGLWIGGPAELELDTLIRQLDTMGAEAIIDAGGWKSLIASAEWIEPGVRPAGMVMDLGAVIQRMIHNAIHEEQGSLTQAAKRLGVADSTLYRWRKQQTTPRAGILREAG